MVVENYLSGTCFPNLFSSFKEDILLNVYSVNPREYLKLATTLKPTICVVQQIKFPEKKHIIHGMGLFYCNVGAHLAEIQIYNSPRCESTGPINSCAPYLLVDLSQLDPIPANANNPIFGVPPHCSFCEKNTFEQNLILHNQTNLSD